MLKQDTLVLNSLGADVAEQLLVFLEFMQSAGVRTQELCP